jgi:hypothetical protein
MKSGAAKETQETFWKGCWKAVFPNLHALSAAIRLLWVQSPPSDRVGLEARSKLPRHRPICCCGEVQAIPKKSPKTRPLLVVCPPANHTPRLLYHSISGTPGLSLCQVVGSCVVCTSGEGPYRLRREPLPTWKWINVNYLAPPPSGPCPSR